MGLYFLKVPTVNPSVTAAPCQLPLAREPFCARYRFIVRYRDLSDFQSTAWEGGSPKTHKPKRVQRLKPRTRAKAKGQSRLVPLGGFLRGEQFERERVVPPLSRLLCILSCRSKKVRPRWQAPGVSPVSISLGSSCRSSLPLQSPVSLLRWKLGHRQPPASTTPKENRNCTARWLPQSRLRRASSLPEGAIGLVPCYIGLCFWGSACWGIPQSKIKDFCQLPQAGSLAASGRRQCARWLSTIRYLPDLPGIVTEQNGERKYRYYARIASGGTPPRPVSLPSKMGSKNIGTVHALTAAARRHYSLKNPPLCRRITT